MKSTLLHTIRRVSLRALSTALGIVFIGGTVSAFQQAPATTDGEEVYNRVCATCHALTPPADMDQKPIAPPMKMIMKHYVASHESDELLTNALNEWLLEPAAERSALPEKAIEHHGLMPKPALSDEERGAVIDYLLTLKPEGGAGMKMNHQMNEKGQNGQKGEMNHKMGGKKNNKM